MSLVLISLTGFVEVTHAQKAEQVLEDRPVQIINRVPPQYPTLALAKKTEGWVKITFTINTDGDVEDITVIESEPAKVFDRAAVKAVSQFKFLAPIKNGEVVSQRTSQLIQFDIQNQEVSNLAFFGGFLQNLNKAQGIAHQSIYGQDDVVLLVKDLRLESAIKADQATLNQLVLKVVPDVTGFPQYVEVMRNDFAENNIELDVEKMKERTLKGAQIAANVPAEYYNPTYIYAMAKNHPPTVFGIMEAKSMPIPDYSHEMTLKAQITINQQGLITKVIDAQIDGEPMSAEFMKVLLDTLVFKPAYQNFEPVEDTVDLTIGFSLVQSSDVEAIKKQWMASPQNKQ